METCAPPLETLKPVLRAKTNPAMKPASEDARHRGKNIEKCYQAECVTAGTEFANIDKHARKPVMDLCNRQINPLQRRTLQLFAANLGLTAVIGRAHV